MAVLINIPDNAWASQLPNIKWWQFIGRGPGWTGDASMAHGPGTIYTLTFGVRYIHRWDFVKYALGHSFRSGNELSRWPPWNFPDAAWLYATRITRTEGVHFTRRSGGGIAGPIAEYDIIKYTVTFETLPYEIWPDGAVQEWDRYVIKKEKPHAEYITREGLRWKYVEGPTGILDKTFTGKTAYPVAKKRLNWTWVQVPETYLFNAAGVPSRLDAAINKLNSISWAGYDPQTLLFESYDIEARSMPMDVLSVSPFVPRTFDVTLHFTHFKPEKGGAVEGWNNDIALDGKWYQTAPIGDTSKRKFRTIDFASIFQAAI